MPRLLYITEPTAEQLVTSLTNRVFPDSPAFQLRGESGRSALLSALGQPQWPYYRTLPEKAGVLHYALNKNHPFADGNKRFALTAMETFLLLNQASLLATADEAEAFALGVAAGDIGREASIDFVRRRTLRAAWGERTYRRWFGRLPADEQATVLDELRDPTGRFFKLLQDEYLEWLAVE